MRLTYLWTGSWQRGLLCSDDGKVVAATTLWTY